MVQMRVRQDDRINFRRRDRQLFPVPLPPFFLALKKAAVDQNLDSLPTVSVPRRVDQMFGSSNGAGCP